MYCTFGAPGSTHDARMLRSTAIYENILAGNVIPDKAITLGEFGDIPLVTIGDSAFPKHSWLLKGYNEDTRDPKQRFFNKKLYSARVVTENAYSMLKGRFRILYKKMKYVIMACVMLHNLCLSVNDPCLPRWRVEVQQLGLIAKQITRFEDKNPCELNRLKIANWLWSN